jgi:hypothetical protein
VRTHPVDKLLEQHCYKSAAGLLQLVRFTCVHVCSVRYFAEYNIIFLFLNVGDGFSATFRCFDSVNS